MDELTAGKSYTFTIPGYVERFGHMDKVWTNQTYTGIYFDRGMFAPCFEATHPNGELGLFELKECADIEPVKVG